MGCFRCNPGKRQHLHGLMLDRVNLEGNQSIPRNLMSNWSNSIFWYVHDLTRLTGGYWLHSDLMELEACDDHIVMSSASEYAEGPQYQFSSTEIQISFYSKKNCRINQIKIGLIHIQLNHMI
jgi:hypothetical protein